MNQIQQAELKKELTPILLWGLGVGYVISGMYFGWNLGLKEGGTMGMAIATFFSIMLYSFFSLSYAELACYIPKAGGVFDYTYKAWGKDLGFIAGFAQIIEFVFAPPAIAFGIGAYFNLFFPSVPLLTIAIGVYLLFTALNIYGVKAAASFELLVTIIAVAEILIFTGVTLPHFKLEHLKQNAFPNGWSGVFASIPFAIWFFLGIEGLANVAEETKNPHRDISRGFGSAISTLVILCVLVFISAVGVGGWEKIVFKNGIDGETSDSPLPLAMAAVVGDNSFLFHMLLSVGIFGLIASFHGLILAFGRSSFEFGKAGFAPSYMGRFHSLFKILALVLFIRMIIGIIALLTNKTGEIINPNFLKLYYPSRWYYDVLKALDYFQYAKIKYDHRMDDAIEFLQSKKTKEGVWKLPSKHPGQTHFEMEQAGKPSRWNTLRALRVLKHFNIPDV